MSRTFIDRSIGSNILALPIHLVAHLECWGGSGGQEGEGGGSRTCVRTRANVHVCVCCAHKCDTRCDGYMVAPGGAKIHELYHIGWHRRRSPISYTPPSRTLSHNIISSRVVQDVRHPYLIFHHPNSTNDTNSITHTHTHISCNTLQHNANMLQCAAVCCSVTNVTSSISHTHTLANTPTPTPFLAVSISHSLTHTRIGWYKRRVACTWHFDHEIYHIWLL